MKEFAVPQEEMEEDIERAMADTQYEDLEEIKRRIKSAVAALR
jgi:hypothetical protein